MGRRYDTVSFLTDWGLTDEFVGVVKAVIRDIAPHATVIDLTHGSPRSTCAPGASHWPGAISYLPSGIVLAVVDPGVGTARRAVAIEVAGGEGVIVGPDNGLLAPAVAMAGGAERAVELTNPDYRLEAPGATFAGRDIFAPAVAHLCNGVDLAELGAAVDAARAAARHRAAAAVERRRAASPRCCGSTTSATASSTSAPTSSTVGASSVRVRIGDDVRVAALADTFAGRGDRRSGWCPTRRGCWRSCSTVGRRPRSCALPPATRSCSSR